MPLVAELLDGVAELGGERLDPGPEDVGEAEQQREADALGVEVHGQVVEVEPALPVGVRVHGDVTLGIDPEIAQTPAAHVVELLGVLGGPGRRGDGVVMVRLLRRGEGAIVMWIERSGESGVWPYTEPASAPQFQ